MKTYRKKATATVTAKLLESPYTVKTLEGTITGKEGDYEVTGQSHEKWIVRKDIFEKTYEEVLN